MQLHDQPRRDERAEDKERGQLEQFGDQLAEAMEFIPQTRPRARHRDAGSEGGEENVGMRERRAGQDKQPDRDREEWLSYGFATLKKREQASNGTTTPIAIPRNNSNANPP